MSSRAGKTNGRTKGHDKQNSRPGGGGAARASSGTTYTNSAQVARTPSGQAERSAARPARAVAVPKSGNISTYHHDPDPLRSTTDLLNDTLAKLAIVSRETVGKMDEIPDSLLCTLSFQAPMKRDPASREEEVTRQVAQARTVRTAIAETIRQSSTPEEVLSKLRLGQKGYRMLAAANWAEREDKRNEMWEMGTRSKDFTEREYSLTIERYEGIVEEKKKEAMKEMCFTFGSGEEIGGGRGGRRTDRRQKKVGER